MADRTETHRQRGNGSLGRTADLGARLAAEPLQDSEELAPVQNGAAAALTQRLNRLTQELAESSQRGAQLKAALDKHTRRVHQLLGERDQLRSLLAARDAELQRLNREVGALATRAAPARAGSPVPPAAVQKVLEKLRHARDAFLGARPAAPRPHEVNVRVGERGLVPWVKDRPPKDILAVVLFGLPEAEIARLLEVVECTCTDRDLAPLLLTDNDSFQLFRNRRVVFEFFPPRSEQERLAPDLDWQLFTLRRLALIRRKWRPIRVVAFGRTAAAVVQLWLDSPFEATPIPAALNGRSLGAELASGAAPQRTVFQQ
jgi:hypothetical protein